VLFLNCCACCIAIFQTDTHVVSIGMTLLIVTMLLPSVLPQLPPCLHELFRIFKRILCWSVVYPATNTNKADTVSTDSSVSATLLSPARSIAKTISVPNVHIDELKNRMLQLLIASVIRPFGRSVVVANTSVLRCTCYLLVTAATMRTQSEGNAAMAAEHLSKPVAKSSPSLPTSHSSFTTAGYLNAMPPKHLQPMVTLYFHHLYGMFPISFVHYLREQSAIDTTFSWLVKVCTSNVTSTAQQEPR
jgi:hypothetical protein